MVRRAGQIVAWLVAANLVVAVRAPAAPTTAVAAWAESLPTRLFPDGTNFVAAFRIDKILESPAVKKSLPKLPDLAGGLEKPVEPKLSLTPRDVESVVFAFDGIKRRAVLVVRLKKDADRSVVNIDANEPPETVGDYEVRLIGPGRAVCLVDSRTLVIAGPEILREVLVRKGSAKLPDELSAALNQIDVSKPAYFATTGDFLLQNLGENALGDDRRRLAAVTGAGVTIGFDDPMRFEAKFRCTDDDSARRLAPLVEQLVAGPLNFFGTRALQKDLDRAKAVAAGSTVTVSAEIDALAIFEIFEKKR
jgi:hypothetical protein